MRCLEQAVRRERLTAGCRGLKLGRVRLVVEVIDDVADGGKLGEELAHGGGDAEGFFDLLADLGEHQGVEAELDEGGFEFHFFGFDSREVVEDFAEAFVNDGFAIGGHNSRNRLVGVGNRGGDRDRLGNEARGGAMGLDFGERLGSSVAVSGLGSIQKRLRSKG